MCGTLSAYTAYAEFTNNCSRLLINLDFCFKVCAPCGHLCWNTGCKMFMALSISCWSMLSHSLLWFLQKSHNYDTAQRTLNRFCQNYHQLTCWLMDICWKFHKICPNTVRNIWQTNVSLFSEHDVYFKLRDVRRILSFCINLIGKLSSKKWTRPNMSTRLLVRCAGKTIPSRWHWHIW